MNQSQTCITFFTSWNTSAVAQSPRPAVTPRFIQEAEKKTTNQQTATIGWWEGAWPQDQISLFEGRWGTRSHGVFLSPVLSRLIVPADTEGEKINYWLKDSITDYNHSPVSRHYHRNQLFTWKALVENVMTLTASRRRQTHCSMKGNIGETFHQKIKTDRGDLRVGNSFYAFKATSKDR